MKDRQHQDTLADKRMRRRLAAFPIGINDVWCGFSARIGYRHVIADLGGVPRHHICPRILVPRHDRIRHRHGGAIIEHVVFPGQ
jgi:hypothetical protein